VSTSSVQEIAPQLIPDNQVTRRILPVVGFTFVAYFSVGVPLALLPTYAHLQLGVNASIAGLLVSIQYIATFASRPRAGRMADTRGPRQTVRYGLLFCAASGFFLLLAALLKHSFWFSIDSLVLSRLVLGVGESMTSTGSTMWGIGRVGSERTARVISWNGVANYLALAIGAPVGVLLGSRWGFAGAGLLILLVCIASYVVATGLAPTAPLRGHPAPLPLRRILLRVTPYGLALALGGMGFGIIGTFITLYFIHRSWQGAALSLTIYGISFMGVRLVFPGVIDRFGGFSVAIVSFIVELAGLLMLVFGNSPGLAYAGCGLAGLGFSFVFPALAVEAANVFPTSVRGSVLGVYSAFIDLSFFLSGPIAGVIIHLYGYLAAFLAIAGAVLLALTLSIWLAFSAKPPIIASTGAKVTREA
jgi:MFS family permease